MRVSRLFLKNKRRFSHTETSFSNQGVLRENVLKDTQRKTGLQKKGTEAWLKGLKLLIPKIWKYVLSRRNRSSTEQSITPTMIIPRTAKMSSNRSRMQQRSKTSAAKPPDTSEVVKKKT